MNQLYVFADNKASAVSEHTYKAEDVLQNIIAENPQLLLGAAHASKELFLIEQEFTLPEYEGSSNAFSLNHLMVDSNEVPALVEVKRSKDTRIRREVVAQMIDYAARMRSVDIENLREKFRLKNNSMEIAEAYDTDEFWSMVDSNLKTEHMSLYFAADAIPDTLITMMDFMRRTMSGIAVYGVEIKQYKSDNAMLLSSSLIGGYRPELIKLNVPTVEWTAASFSEQLLCLKDESLLDVAKNIQESSAELGYSVVFGKGAKQPTFRGVLGKTTIFQVAIFPFNNPPKSNIEICLPAIQQALGYASDEQLRALFNDFPDKEAAIEREDIRNTNQYLYYNLSYFKDSETLKLFIKKLAKVCDELAGIS